MKHNSLFNDPQFPHEVRKNDWPWMPVESSLPVFVPTDQLPRISIITPSFNQGQFVEETIRSVLLQNYPNLEYIIVDGGSTDNTLEAIKKYEPWISYWVSEADRGQSHAINKGFAQATGDIVAWLNADDIYLPGALFNVAKTYLESKAEWIVGITQFTDINLNVLDRFVPQINTGIWKIKNYKSHQWLDFVMTHQSGTALPQVSSFWSRSAVVRAGGIDESFRYAMDHDLYGRLAHVGYRPKIIPQTLASFRRHDEQKTKEFPLVFWKEELSSVKQWQLAELTADEKMALAAYEVWFKRFIQWEQFATAIRLKSLNYFARKIAGKVKKELIELRISLLGKKSTDVQLKGIVSKSVIARYVPPNPIIVEAGAHIGLDTEELARYFPQGTIYAFEPIPELFLQLAERTRPYKNVHCLPIALSAQAGEAIMYISSGVSDGSSSLLPPKDHLTDHPDVMFEKTIRVSCVTIDDWAQANKIKKVDLLWLDMQGHELNAMKSGLKVLETVKTIYTEVNLKEAYEGAPLYGELREWLDAQDFRVEIEEIPWDDGGNVLFVRKDTNKEK